MIQRREKLCNIECNDTSVILLELSYLNEMCEIDTGIDSGLLFNVS